MKSVRSCWKAYAGGWGWTTWRISVRDALDFRPDLEGALDGVLLDAPCAGWAF